MQSTDLSPATAGRLRRLRRQVAALITLLALIVVSVFAFAVVRLDGQLRDQRIESDLLRETDLVSRALRFEDRALQPEDRSDLLDQVIIGVRPPFDLFAILEERDLWGQIPEPSDEEIVRRVREIFDEADGGVQHNFLHLVGDPDNEDNGPLIETLYESPPQQLWDEAFRQYVAETADDAGLDLDLDTTVEIGDVLRGTVDEAALIDAVAAVADDDIDEIVAIDGRDGRLLARGTVLRDGVEIRGAVLAIIDPARSEREHRRFRNQVIGTALLLVVGSTLAAWFVAGRTIRPTATALAQQERFLADAAHELRTPIAAIRATAEAGAGRPDQAADRLRRIATLATGASGLTDDLLTLAQMDAQRLDLEKEPLRLDLLVEALADEHGEACIVDATEVVIDADPRLLERAISNLLRNAVAHGGASPTSPARVVVDRTGVEVIDNGPGLPAGGSDVLFDRFSSGAESSGHGLGLPLARWIARSHGGDITARNNPNGVGASFHLHLDSQRSS